MTAKEKPHADTAYKPEALPDQYRGRRALDRAADFYAELLDLEGRMQMGVRCYFDAGGVTLQVVQTPAPQLAAKALYFAVADVDAVHARAAKRGCLSAEQVHGTPSGEPWSVDEGTIYAG